MSIVRLEPLFRVCPICTAGYQIFNSLQQTCGDVACKAEHRRQRELKRAARAERAKLRTWRQESKSIGKLLSDAQKAFNRYVRERDFGLPCISSGRAISMKSGVLRGHMVDAGHYRSTGAAPHLRFNEDNCHAQSVADNRDLSGNTVEYRKGLVERIGLARVEALENDNRTHKWSRDELIEIRRVYAAKARELRAIRESKG